MTANCPTCNQPLPESKIHVNLDLYQLIFRGQSFKLSQNESLLLQALIKVAPAVASREELSQAVHGGAARSEQAIDQYIKRLRNRLSKQSIAMTINTVRGKGYALQL